MKKLIINLFVITLIYSFLSYLFKDSFKNEVFGAVICLIATVFLIIFLKNIDSDENV